MTSGNAHYLVTDSGDAFADGAARSAYLRLIERTAAALGLKAPAYAVLPGRALLYLVTPGPDPREVMGRLAPGAELPGYRTGRCKYKLVQPEKYAAHLARFIHLEPVREGLAAAPEAYEWSSAAGYLGGAGFASKELVLGLFGAAPEAALAAYRAFMAEPVPGKFRRPFDKNRDAVLGDREFVAAHSPHGEPGA